MTGKKIYIRTCKIKGCLKHIDKGVSESMCTDHSHDFEARVEIQKKRKVIREQTRI